MQFVQSTNTKKVFVLSVIATTRNFHFSSARKLKEFSRIEMEQVDKLVEIPVGEWFQLQELFRCDWPKHIIAFNVLDNAIRWLKQDPQLKYFKFFSLNGDWSDGTFIQMVRIVGAHLMHSYSFQFVQVEEFIFFDTLEESGSRLERALLLFNWSEERSVFCLRHQLLPTTIRVFGRLKLHMDMYPSTYLYFTPIEKILPLKVNCPPGITLKRLSVEHAEQINNAWPFRDDKSLAMKQMLIKFNPSVGVFNGAGELVAWSLLDTFQSGHALQVAEKHKGKGYGKLVRQACRLVVAKSGINSTGSVVLNNTVMHRIIEQEGVASIIDCNHWFVVKQSPKVPQHRL